MKVKDLANVLMTRSNRIVARTYSNSLHLICTFYDFKELTKNILNEKVVAIYPQSDSETYIEISL